MILLPLVTSFRVWSSLENDPIRPLSKRNGEGEMTSTREVTSLNECRLAHPGGCLVQLRKKMSAAKRLPVVAVLGSTGTGKSKLGIDIAKRFCGEVINCDAMQVYVGLPIITNKVRAEEQDGVPHRMMGFVNPGRQFTVVDFRNLALPIITSLVERGKMAVIVGGTNYYLESILWDVLISENAIDDRRVPISRNENLVAEEEGLQITNEDLHSKLAEIDPDMAKILHPNNRRKVLRSLEVFEQTKRRHSDVLREQHSANGASTLGGPLRFPNSCIFWLHCDQKVLDKRLDARVDKMLEDGLIDELLEFHERQDRKSREDGIAVDYTNGIFQSIGFKEFHDYLILPGEERQTPQGQKLLDKGIEEMKMVTRRYSRKQIKWIRNRFVRRADRDIPPLYKFDFSLESEYREKVADPALRIVESLIEGDISSELRVEVEHGAKPDYALRRCHVCNISMLGDSQWQAHKKSKKHRALLRKQDSVQTELC